MKRRTLVKLSSLFAVTSIFSASVSIFGNKRVDAQQFRRVDPRSSSCARQIDAVFQYYRLRVKSFDIRYVDRSGNYYQYASNRVASKSMEKIDEQPSPLLSPMSLDTDSNFENSKRIIAQGQSWDEQVLTAIQKVMANEGVTLWAAQVFATRPDGSPCIVNYTYSSGVKY